MARKVKNWSEMLEEIQFRRSFVYREGCKFVYDSGDLPDSLVGVAPGTVLALRRPHGITATQMPGKAEDWIVIGSGEGGSIPQIVDEDLDEVSTNAVQNKVIKEALDGKVSTVAQNYTDRQKETARTNIGAQENITTMQDVQPIVAALNDRTAVIDQQTSVVKALGYKVLNPNLSFTSQVTNENTVYEIRDNFTLSSGTVTIPLNCTLYFNGGMISSGTIIGNSTKIKDTSARIFSGMSFGGTWDIDYFRPEWWGGKADGETDNSGVFNSAFYYGMLFKIPVKLSAGTYKCIPRCRERRFGNNYLYYIYACVNISTANNLKVVGDKTTVLIDTTSIVDEENYDQSFFLFIDKYYRVTLQNITFAGKTKVNGGTDAITTGTTPLATATSIMKNYASIVGCDPVGGGAGLTLDNVDVV